MRIVMKTKHLHPYISLLVHPGMLHTCTKQSFQPAHSQSCLFCIVPPLPLHRFINHKVSFHVYIWIPFSTMCAPSLIFSPFLLSGFKKRAPRAVAEIRKFATKVWRHEIGIWMLHWWFFSSPEETMWIWDYACFFFAYKLPPPLFFLKKCVAHPF